MDVKTESKILLTALTAAALAAEETSKSTPQMRDKAPEKCFRLANNVIGFSPQMVSQKHSIFRTIRLSRWIEPFTSVNSFIDRQFSHYN